MIYLIPVLNAAFGWLTISSLFYLLFHPYEKKNLAESNPKKLQELKGRYDFYARQAVPPKNVKSRPTNAK